MILVSELSDPSEFADLRLKWSDLLTKSGEGPFNAWEWLYPWFRLIGRDRKLMILCAHDSEGQLLGIMPLCLDRPRIAGLRVTRIGFLGDTHVGSDYLDAITLPGQRASTHAAFARHLKVRSADWDVLELEHLSSDSETVDAFRGIFGDASHRFEVTPRSTCPRQDFLPGETFDLFLKKTRRSDNYLRRRRWLERQPGYRIECTELPQDLTAPMADFVRLHHLRWQDEGGSQGIRGPSVEAFHREACRLLAESKMLRLYTLWVEEHAIASVYGIRHLNTFYYFQSGYDPAWRNRSPGMVLVGETFKNALEQGCTAYDFLRGTEPYKSEWVSGQRKTVRMQINLRRGKGEIFVLVHKYLRHAKALSRRWMPQRWVERIRRRRTAQSHI